MQIQSSNGKQAITTVEEWLQHAPPEHGELHWKEGLGTYELANAWCGVGAGVDGPREIIDLLRSNPKTQHLKLGVCTPECPIYFDNLRGEPRNADLAIVATDDEGTAAVTIEAEADEPFGDYVKDLLAAAVERIADDEKTNAVLRVQQLAASLLPARTGNNVSLGKLRYQLLSAVAVSLAYAAKHQATRAIVVFHEFHTSATRTEKVRQNEDDLNAFVYRITGGEVQTLAPGVLIGPVTVPGRPLFPEPVPLYIGKVVETVAPSTLPVLVQGND